MGKQVALTFVNDTCQSTHGNVRLDSVFISPSGEWKLGGFELLSSPKDDGAVLYVRPNSRSPRFITYWFSRLWGRSCRILCSSVPRRLRPGGGPLRKSALFLQKVRSLTLSYFPSADVAAPDAYEFGLLLHAVFNPTQPLPLTTIPPHPAPTATSRGAIPTAVFPSFKRLLVPRPKARLSTKAFLEIGNGEKAADGSGFFSQNRLVKVCHSLESFNLSSESEKATFLRYE